MSEIWGTPETQATEAPIANTAEEADAILAGASNKPMNEQKEILIETFNKWKGANNQIDDILVIGIRV